MGTNVRKILKKEENKKIRKAGNRRVATPLAFLILFILSFLVMCWYFLYVTGGTARVSSSTIVRECLEDGLLGQVRT